ncbi:TOP2 [Candida jiufengensis]|uniref:TOP2 n=1 Tax=Candida jiufengensis TaxID=497108 RepID=UPI0022253BD3|nr:TOP2 [Candida jiufengensis]KAI5954990.1 TOP2 [Candida jiufengensis]
MSIVSDDDMSDIMSDESDYQESSTSKSKSISKPKQKQKTKKPLSESSTSLNTPTTNTTTKPSSASETYQKLSQLEHILKRPDTYIGSVEKTSIEMWCFDSESEQMQHKEVSIVPGLYKIFDEILVNAADNKIRDPTMRNIKVKIDPENNVIQVYNDGRGIPIEMHTKEKMWIPELIFGNLLTSSNYDDDEKKVTGGRNGFGAKLCNIFSTQFEVETADLNTGKLYKQVWTNNMSKVNPPKISDLKSKKEYTKITFKPDLSKFDMDSLDEDLLSVLRRRVYDLCGTVRDCNVYLNDKRLSTSTFRSYVEMYVKAIKERSPEPEPTGEISKNHTTIVHEVFNDRWEVAFALSDGSFNQVSFVNSIATTAGGTHVKYVSDQIINKLVDTLSKKEKGKKKLMIKPVEVRENMFIFINCLIENPAFTSQTKEQLTTKSSQFGGKDKFVASDDLIKRILRTGIAEKIKAIANANEDKALQKADGSKKQRIKGQVNLVDANKAGTRDGYKCTLILTEGLSAKNLAVAGMTVIGRDYYGCFPLRGKLLNVREASNEQIAKNAEINALKQIIGLQHKKQYTPENIKTLRYGHIMIMTDQDQDGSHIKGLIINFIETSFPGLLDIPGFLLEFITPIVKVTIKGRGAKKVIPFYSMPDFESWREGEGKTCRWTQKYYKGLGTSTLMEAREYFQALDRHMKRFHALQGDDKSCIDLAFSKKKADERKDWLQNYIPGNQLDPELNEIPISDFINKELILFSMSDNVRSIPSVLDGLKPGQRKVLYGCFKRKLKNEIKVAQLAAYVAESTGYHHGEVSLVQTIIGMAQNFIGSNNINVLKPNGAFGSREAGGKDAAAARYIFTELTEITRAIFNPADDPIYTYVQDDEQTVEPQWFLPVLPMVLVNGAEGIGTGWSTNIPSFNPKDIVENIRRLMKNEPLMEMTPWYKGWEGNIEPNGPQKYKVTGKIEQIDENTLEITEIPIKTWTNNIKEFLLAGFGTDKTPQWIKDMEEHHTTSIRFVIKLSDQEMEKALKVGLLEKFKLVSSLSLGNMVAFDPYGRIKKYNEVNDILKDFFYVRLEYYEKRKSHMLEVLQQKLTMIAEQARFVKMIIDKQLSVANKKKKELIEILESHDFVKFTKDGKPIPNNNNDNTTFIDENDSEEEIENAGDVSALNLKQTTTEVEGEHRPDTIFSSYEYLLGMTIWSLTYERYIKLINEKDNLQKELEILIGKTAIDLWNFDLDEFIKQYDLFLQRDEQERDHLASNGPKKKQTKKRKATEPKKEPATKKLKAEPNEIKKAKSKEPTPISVASSTTSTSTPVPIVKKEPPKSSSSDILSFFSPSSKTKRPQPKIPTAVKPSSSMFDSDDDDIFEIISTPEKNKISNIKSNSNTTTTTNTNQKKSKILDELDDLTIMGEKVEILEDKRRSRSRPSATTTNKKKKVIIDSDEDDDDESDEEEEEGTSIVNIDDDDDDYDDE